MNTIKLYPLNLHWLTGGGVSNKGKALNVQGESDVCHLLTDLRILIILSMPRDFGQPTKIHCFRTHVANKNL